MKSNSKLFKLPFEHTQESLPPKAVDSPTGPVVLEAKLNSRDLCKEPANIIGTILNTAQIFIWDKKDYQLEVLRVMHKPSLPEGMEVDCCITFLCRFKNLSPQLSTEFACRLKFEEEILDGEPESGEGLIAQSWQSAHTRLTIGTEDEEYLLARANRKNSLPQRFAKESLLSSDSIDYLSDGIKLTLPPFLKSEEGQIQFVIAWSSLHKPDDVSTWFAVDIDPDEILASVASPKLG